MNGMSKWGGDDWLDRPFWRTTLRVLRYLWPIIGVAAGLLLLRYVWGFGPFVFFLVVIGLVYLIQRWRWAVQDSSG